MQIFVWYGFFLSRNHSFIYVSAARLGLNYNSKIVSIHDLVINCHQRRHRSAAAPDKALN